MSAKLLENTVEILASNKMNVVEPIIPLLIQFIEKSDVTFLYDVNQPSEKINVPYVCEKPPEVINPLFEKYKASSTIKRAMRSAYKFNQKLNRQRLEDRQSYFDPQTMLVFYPQPNPIKINETSKVLKYPLAVFPWQYQTHYQKYAPEFLKTLPLNTQTAFTPGEKIFDKSYLEKLYFYEDRTQIKNNLSEQPILGETMETLLSEEKVLNDETDTLSIDSLPKSQIQQDWCQVCNQSTNNDMTDKAFLISCTECFKTGHPSCFGLTQEMTQIIQTYAWQCLNCKSCVKCTNQGNEGQMMCCDKCDRGYHSYCVGLASIPQNQWECPECQKF